MKKLMYLLVAGTMFVFTACTCGADAAATEEVAVEEVVVEEVVVEEVSACADDCQKACCLGCKATEGDAACKADHSCCAVHAEEGAEEAHDHGAEGHSHE